MTPRAYFDSLATEAQERIRAFWKAWLASNPGVRIAAIEEMKAK